MILSPLQENLVNSLIDLSIREDIGDGDHTSLACIDDNAPQQQAHLLVKEAGVLCGLGIAERVFRKVDPKLVMQILIEEGKKVQPGDIAFTLSGHPRSILMAERIALNCMQRMSGIATFTRRLAEMIAHTPAKLIDTRKTAPGQRVMEKWAVATGGGGNHRMGLYDMIMIKDNHIDYAGGIEQAIERVRNYLREKNLNLKIEVEARNMEEVERILAAGGVHRIMFDNFKPGQVVDALKLVAGKTETEASGGIGEHNLVEYAETGVDFISMGALTHQVRSLDLSLKAVK